MTYEEARGFIENSNQYGSRPGLTVITELLRRLNHPQKELKIIHIAGTNGKGSVAAFLASILASEGYLVGRYNSPAVFTYREIIQLSKGQISKKIRANKMDILNEYITEEGIIAAIKEIKPHCEAMVREGFHHPTSFEIETAMAFFYLKRVKVDFAIIEVGLGGRLDATNVISNPLCSVITSISMDHMQYLGETLEEIAYEKAGIIKKGVPVVSYNNSPEVMKVFEKVCKEMEAEFTIISDASRIDLGLEKTSFCYDEEEYSISLLGEHQIKNAILALQTAATLREYDYTISTSSIKKGLSQTRWRGRFEILRRDPYFIMDGAHNEDAAHQLKISLLKYFPNKKLILIMGVLADKDYKKILEIITPLAEVLITVTPNNSRALNSSSLAAEAFSYTKAQIFDGSSVKKALELAYKRASREDIILAFGSLSYLSEIYDSISGL